MVISLVQFKRISSAMVVFLGNLLPRRGIPVLLYHSVDNSGSVISITPSEFRAHMEYFHHSGYRTISLEEYLKYLQADTKLPQRAVVLTFDDGFKNNYSEALPVLRKFGFTASIFIVTNRIGGTCSWEKDESIPEIPMLSWDEIREMNDYGIDFGAHSCSHPHLSKISKERLKNELLNSKWIIESQINRPVKFLSYPYSDFNRETTETARECGFLAAFGGVDFSLNNTKEDLYNLKRLGTAHFSSLQDFKAGLLGTYDWYIKLKRMFVTKE